MQAVLFQEHKERLKIQCSSTAEDTLERLDTEQFDAILLSQLISNTEETKFAIRMLSEAAGAPVLSIAALHTRDNSEVYAQLFKDGNSHSLLAHTLATPPALSKAAG